MLDFEGRITVDKQSGRDDPGYSQEELLTMKISDVLASESGNIGEQMLTSGHQRTNYEVDVVTKAGRVLTAGDEQQLITKGFRLLVFKASRADISARRRTEEALREADQRALSEYERLLERISGLAQALGTSRELTAIFRGLREFTKASVPCDGFFVSLYDPIQDVRRRVTPGAMVKSSTFRRCPQCLSLCLAKQSCRS